MPDQRPTFIIGVYWRPTVSLRWVSVQACQYLIKHVGLRSGMLVSEQTCRYPIGLVHGLRSDISVSNGSLRIIIILFLTSF